jgi:hypothetical protein
MPMGRGFLAFTDQLIEKKSNAVRLGDASHFTDLQAKIVHEGFRGLTEEIDEVLKHRTFRIGADFMRHAGSIEKRATRSQRIPAAREFNATLSFRYEFEAPAGELWPAYTVLRQTPLASRTRHHDPGRLSAQRPNVTITCISNQRREARQNPFH